MSDRTQYCPACEAFHARVSAMEETAAALRTQLAASSAREARLREAILKRCPMHGAPLLPPGSNYKTGAFPEHFNGSAQWACGLTAVERAALADPPRPVEGPAPCLRCGRPLVCAPCLEATSAVAAPAPRYVCRKCGNPMSDGEGKAFTVCGDCWPATPDDGKEGGK